MFSFFPQLYGMAPKENESGEKGKIVVPASVTGVANAELKKRWLRAAGAAESDGWPMDNATRGKTPMPMANVPHVDYKRYNSDEACLEMLKTLEKERYEAGLEMEGSLDEFEDDHYTDSEQEWMWAEMAVQALEAQPEAEPGSKEDTENEAKWRILANGFAKMWDKGKEKKGGEELRKTNLHSSGDCQDTQLTKLEASSTRPQTSDVQGKETSQHCGKCLHIEGAVQQTPVHSDQRSLAERATVGLNAGNELNSSRGVGGTVQHATLVPGGSGMAVNTSPQLARPLLGPGWMEGSATQICTRPVEEPGQERASARVLQVQESSNRDVRPLSPRPLAGSEVARPEANIGGSSTTNAKGLPPSAAAFWKDNRFRQNKKGTPAQTLHIKIEF